MNMPILCSGRCELRPLSLNDFDEIFRLYQEPNIHKYIPHLEHKTLAEHTEILKGLIAYGNTANGLGFWIVRDKQTADFIGIVNLNWSESFELLHIGAQFGTAYWSQGYGSETLEVLLQYGLEVLGLSPIHAIVSKAHLASQKMLKNIGMSFLKTVDRPEEKDIQIYSYSTL